jgi:hypothetical protein
MILATCKKEGGRLPSAGRSYKAGFTDLDLVTPQSPELSHKGRQSTIAGSQIHALQMRLIGLQFELRLVIGRK